MTRTRWGEAFGVITGFAAITVLTPVAIGAGVVSAIKGDGFDQGADEVYDTIDPLMDRAADFGDEHADSLTNGAKVTGKAVAQGLIAAATGRAAGGAFPKKS